MSGRNTTTLERPTTAGAAVGEARRAMLALARVETVRLLRHPVVLAGLALLLAGWLYPWLTGGGNMYPVLHDQDWSGQLLAMLTLGGAAMIATNLAVLRAHRHGTAAVYDVLVLPRAWHTGAFLLAVVPFAALAAVLVGVRLGLLAALQGAAGAPNPYELAAYPAVVLLLGTLGVVLGRLAPAVIVPPLVLLALAVATFAGALGGSLVSWLRWLLPVAVEEPPMPLPADLMTRPAGPHLAYLIALVVVAGVAALVAAGARGRRLVGAGAAGLAVAVLAGSAQFLPVDDAVREARVTAVEHPRQMQTCRRIEQVTYCAFDDFTPWIDGWDTVVRGVLRRLPESQATRPLAVRQRISLDERLNDSMRTSGPEDQQAVAELWRRADAEGGTPNAVTTGTRWGDDRAAAGLAGLIAYDAVTGRGTPTSDLVCGGRSVLIGWLAGQATPESAAGLREEDDNSWGAVFLGDPVLSATVSVPDREMAVVWQLLRRPADEVADLVQRHWAELSATGTSAERVGEIFGATVPPLPPEEERDTCTG